MGRKHSRNLFQLGFTLVEMLVVMALISALGALVASNLLRSQKRGMDGRRQGDVRTIQNAFEQYFAVNDRYPQDTAEAGSEFPGGRLPADPRNAGEYVYTITYDTAPPVGQRYCACARLETIDGNNTAGDCSFDMSDPNYFCAQNLQ